MQEIQTLVTTTRCDLIETLSLAILSHMFSQSHYSKLLHAARITIKKPHVAIPFTLDYAAVELFRTKKQMKELLSKTTSIIQPKEK